MAHVHGDVPAAERPIGGRGPSPGPVPGGWIRISLDPLEVPSQHESRPHLRRQPAKIERAQRNDVDPVLIGIGTAFFGMVAIGLLGKGLAGVLFWLL